MSVLEAILETMTDEHSKQGSAQFVKDLMALEVHKDTTTANIIALRTATCAPVVNIRNDMEAIMFPVAYDCAYGGGLTREYVLKMKDYTNALIAHRNQGCFDCGHVEGFIHALYVLNQSVFEMRKEHGNAVLQAIKTEASGVKA